MLPAPLQKYWDRHSPQEQEMQFDEEGLYSLTPQVVANQIARNTRGQLVVDAFCGIGGNAIAFARTGKRVIAIDSNASGSPRRTAPITWGSFAPLRMAKGGALRNDFGCGVLSFGDIFNRAGSFR